jgi:two-component system OmpR family response regulator
MVARSSWGSALADQFPLHCNPRSGNPASGAFSASRHPVVSPEAIRRYSSGMRILMVEDDRETANFVAKGLREEGHVVDVADNGRDGLVQAVGQDYDIAIVDRMLPELDGKSIVEAMRTAGRQTPVLFLSAMAEVRHRVEGLKAGADDYLTKPFAFSELIARIDALGRRSNDIRAETFLRVDDLEMDLVSRTVRRGEVQIDLQPREFKLLEFLMRHSGQVVTRTMLLEHVWDYHFDPQTNVIDVHISRLRQKIDKEFGAPLLLTVRGAGYTLRAAD